jgi:integrase/recombinase XerC
MSETQSYHTQLRRKLTIKLRDLAEDLPISCGDFFRALEPRTSLLTRVNYAHDLRLFFSYLGEHGGKRFRGLSNEQFTDDVLNAVTKTDIERYLEHLNYYVDENGQAHQNANPGKARKLAALKSFFRYLYQSERIAANVLDKVEMPKVREKEIIRLEPDEVAKLLDAVDSGETLTKTQARYHRLTRTRDVAMLTLLLGTGIRISELVGLDMGHIDFSALSFIVTRKGGDRVVLYFGQEVEKALKAYLRDRQRIDAQPGHEQALFLSLQRRRMSQRAIQKLVDKYASAVTPLKRISPHKFRSTFGTMLNRETGDIYLVADVLGNKDVNTTRRHYAAIGDMRRREALRVIKLRDE